MSARMDAYVALERVMLALEAANDPMADQIRDLMDPIWYGLSDDETRTLENRDEGGAASAEPE